MHESPGMHYQCYATDGKNTQNPVTLHPWESLKYLNQFQCIPHNLFTTYNSFYLLSEKHLTFSTETHGKAISPHKVRKEKVWAPKGELIRFSDIISQDQNNDKTDLSSQKNTFHRLTITKSISKSRRISFWQKPTFCKCQTLCYPYKGILACFLFLVLQSSNKTK